MHNNIFVHIHACTHDHIHTKLKVKVKVDKLKMELSRRTSDVDLCHPHVYAWVHLCIHNKYLTL